LGDFTIGEDSFILGCFTSMVEIKTHKNTTCRIYCLFRIRQSHASEERNTFTVNRWRYTNSHTARQKHKTDICVSRFER